MQQICLGINSIKTEDELLGMAILASGTSKADIAYSFTSYYKKILC